MSRLTFAIRSKIPHGSDGLNDSWLCTADFIGRENQDNSPYLIPNEVICGHIAHFLHLPLPPFALLNNPGGKTIFASLQFTREDSEPDDFVPDTCYKVMPDICTGVVMFDILIANEDRHDGNIQTDSASKPKIIRIIDHDRALFGCFPNNGESRLNKLMDRLGISGGKKTGGNRHCLLDHIGSLELIKMWINRIEQIPDWFIIEKCRSVVRLGAKSAELEAAIKFLIHRKNNLAKNCI